MANKAIKLCNDISKGCDFIFGSSPRRNRKGEGKRSWRNRDWVESGGGSSTTVTVKLFTSAFNVATTVTKQ